MRRETPWVAQPHPPSLQNPPPPLRYRGSRMPGGGTSTCWISWASTPSSDHQTPQIFAIGGGGGMPPAASVMLRDRQLFLFLRERDSPDSRQLVPFRLDSIVLFPLVFQLFWFFSISHPLSPPCLVDLNSGIYINYHQISISNYVHFQYFFATMAPIYDHASVWWVRSSLSNSAFFPCFFPLVPF